VPHRHRVTIDLSARLHQRVRAGARRHGVTLAAYVRMVLQEKLSGSSAGSSRDAMRINHAFLAAVRDPVVEYYKQSVDREALRRNLRMTPEERIRALDEEMNRMQRDSAAPKAAEAVAPDDMPWFGVLKAKTAHAKGLRDTASASARVTPPRKKKPR
jgi:hypothetical protein